MIVGLTGSFGAGKGVVVDYLIEQKGFKHYSARSYITREIERRGMPVDRNSMIEVANDLRAQFGPAHVVETLYAEAEKNGGDAVVESLRAVAEVRRLKELGGTVLGVDADPHIRYDRAFSRGSETDKVTFEEWLDQEQRESNPDDPTKQDIFGALKESDHLLTNNGSLEDLHAQIEQALT